MVKLPEIIEDAKYTQRRNKHSLSFSALHKNGNRTIEWAYNTRKNWRGIKIGKGDISKISSNDRIFFFEVFLKKMEGDMEISNINTKIIIHIRLTMEIIYFQEVNIVP